MSKNEIMAINPLLNLKNVVMPVSRARPFQINPYNFSGNSITCSPSSSSIIEFKIPSLTVFVPSQLMINYQWASATPAAGLWAYSYEGGATEFTSLYVGTMSGVPILDLQFADKYSMSMAALEMPYEMYQNRMQGGSDVLYPCNDLSQIAAGVYGQAFTPFSQDGLSTGTDTECNIPYRDPAMQRSSGNAAAVALTVYRNWKFADMYPNTFFCIDKPLCFGMDLIIRITTSPAAQWGFFSNTGDAINIPNATNTVFTANIDLTKLFLNCPVEVNEAIRNKLINGVESGYSFSVPYVQVLKYAIPAATTSTSFTTNISKSYGRALKKAVWVAFNNSQSTATYVPVQQDNSNVNGTKVKSIQAKLDGRQLTDSPVLVYNPSNSVNPNNQWSSTDQAFNDKDWNWQYFKGCALPSYESFLNKWAYIQSFGSFTMEQRKKYNLPDDWQCEEGLNLAISNDRQLSVDIACPFNGVATSNTYTNGISVYNFNVYLKTINVTPLGIVVEM